MGGIEKGMEMAGTAFVPAYFHVLNSLKLRLLPKKFSREWRGGEDFCVHLLSFWSMLQ
jgi:hypothetical protein